MLIYYLMVVILNNRITVDGISYVFYYILNTFYDYNNNYCHTVVFIWVGS